ncbi:MAG: NAD(P)/FAD-dependent oxidoreductase [Bacteroidota bacterium]
MKIAVVGGGFMGMALSFKLAGPGKELTLFERNQQWGGLATYHDYQDFVWDRFYHVILPQDRDLLGILHDLGLKDDLRWKQTLTGYYVNEKFYSISNSKEFLLFPPLDPISKFRLALTILRGSRINDWRELENQTVEQWLVKMGGRKTFEKFWKPLLLAKLGENYTRVSAVFIWTYIKRLFAARDSSAQKEQMGYVAGGYRTVFDRLEYELVNNGVALRNNTEVSHIRPAENGGIYLTANGEEQYFDKVVFTSPSSVLDKVADPSLYSTEGDHSKVEYLGVVCLVLRTTRELTPYYVVNISDQKIPFTGVIGMTALVDRQYTAGQHLTYFPKYIINTDPMLQQSDEELKKAFLEGVKAMYPDLKEEEILGVHLNRAFRVQPLQVLNYDQIRPRTRTRHEDFYLLNTSQFINDTLNNDSVARHVNRFMEEFAQEFSARETSSSLA